MRLIPILKELSRRKRWVAFAPVFALLIVVGIAKKEPSTQVYTASKQMLVDTTDSSVSNASKNIELLSVRAGIYAQIMTNAGVMNLIGQAAGIPGDEITSTGPANTVGQSATHLATVPSAGGYALTMSLPDPQTEPIIAITSLATTSAKATALANGAGLGLTDYISHLATAYGVPAKDSISIRDLGAPSVSVVTSGIAKPLLPVIFLIGVSVWCVLVLFGSRFAQGWRTYDASASRSVLSEYDAARVNGTPLAADAPGHDATAARNSSSGEGASVSEFPRAATGAARSEPDPLSLRQQRILSKLTR